MSKQLMEAVDAILNDDFVKCQDIVESELDSRRDALKIEAKKAITSSIRLESDENDDDDDDEDGGDE